MLLSTLTASCHNRQLNYLSIDPLPTPHIFSQRYKLLFGREHNWNDNWNNLSQYLLSLSTFPAIFSCSEWREMEREPCVFFTIRFSCKKFLYRRLYIDSWWINYFFELGIVFLFKCWRLRRESFWNMVELLCWKLSAVY